MKPAPIPESLQEEAESALAESTASLDRALLQEHRPALLNLFAASPFAARIAHTCSDLLESVLRDPTAHDLDLPDPQESEVADCLRALRRARTREMLRIMFRDINGLAELPQTLHDQSAFADRAVTGAVAWCRARMRGASPTLADGTPVPFVVLGMGKLGGAELNFSSDIDLIFAYPDPASDREEAQAFFIRLGQKTIQLLDEVTADGFVFRVDMRLRPFGSTGSLALPFSAMETYYQNHGREWERYALLKARPLGAPTAAGTELKELLRPFVFRRSLDFQVLEELRTMKTKMERHARQEQLADDLKHGPGGIREAEFIVQCNQLIFGGREPALQQTAWMQALDAMRACDKIGDDGQRQLRDAYLMLRAAENRLQMLEDQQVHTLPTDAQAQARLGFALGYPDWGAFMAALDQQREALHQEFVDVLHIEETATEQQPTELKALLYAIETIGQPEHDMSSLGAVLTSMGIATEAEDVAQRLHGLVASAAWRAQSRSNLHYALALIPKMIEAAATRERPAQTLHRLFDILEVILHNSSYTALLTENPAALKLLTALVDSSPWVRTQILKAPHLLDELLSPDTLFGTHTPDSLQHILTLAMPTDEDDLEQQMKVLRQFHQAQTLQVAACNLTRSRSLSDVSDELTWVAETITRRAWATAMRQQLNRHGQPHCTVDGVRREAHGAILACGKFGGLEMGFNSDLDLVFVHDSHGEEQMTDGDKPVENEYFFTRVAQRFIHIMEALTADGTLYQVDTRLRPGGDSGQPVCSLRYYAQYMQEKAWTWEHQALARTRAVAGHATACAAFEQIRADILCLPREMAALQKELSAMRQKMYAAHPAQSGHFHIKQDPGGITDLEFMVHYNVLLHASNHPELVEVTATVMILDRLAECGLMDTETSQFLRSCYFTYRNRTHMLHLQESPPHTTPEEFKQERERIRQLWDQTFEPAT